MVSKNCKLKWSFLLVFVLVIFGGCKDKWVEPVPPTLITESYKHASAKCSLNGGEWEANAYIEIYGNRLTLELISEYEKGVGKMLRCSSPYFSKFTILSEGDSNFSRVYNMFKVIDVDVSAGNWYLYDSLSLYNYLAIDSISPDSMYVKGRFSGNFKNNYPDGFWQNVNDPNLAPWIEIRDGTFEGRVYSKQ